MVAVDLKLKKRIIVFNNKRRLKTLRPNVLKGKRSFGKKKKFLLRGKEIWRGNKN